MTSNPFDKTMFLKNAEELSPADLDHIASCIILAPHADDESLGCGGLIAMLKDKNIEVSVILTTDGSQSHPNSKEFPPAEIARIRKEEVTRALAILGVTEQDIYFLEGRDSSLPAKNEEGFEILANKLQATISLINPQLILVPYELDPHRDHRATWQLLNEAIQDNAKIKVWEYLIWLYELAEVSDIPHLKIGELKKLNIAPFLDLKKQAINSHVSQTTRLIHDDLTGFMLKPDVISHFTTEFEYFIDRR